MRFENINYSVHPVSGLNDFGRAFKALEKLENLTYVFLINCGGNVDLPERLRELEPQHPKLKAVLLDSRRPYHLSNLNERKKVIIVNDDYFKRIEGKWPTTEEIDFMHKFENNEEEDEAAPEKKSKEIRKASADFSEDNGNGRAAGGAGNGDGLFDHEEEDAPEVAIGRKRQRRKQAEREKAAKRVEEIGGLSSRQNHAVLQRGFFGKADDEDGVHAVSAAEQGRREGAVAVGAGAVQSIFGVQFGQGRVHVPAARDQEGVQPSQRAGYGSGRR